MVLIHVFSDILHLSHSLLSDILPSRAFTRYAYVFHCQDCPLFIVHPDGGHGKGKFPRNITFNFKLLCRKNQVFPLIWVFYIVYLQASRSERGAQRAPNRKYDTFRALNTFHVDIPYIILCKKKSLVCEDHSKTQMATGEKNSFWCRNHDHSPPFT